MEQHGGNIYDKQVKIDFSVNVNPFGMPARIKEAAMQGVEESFRYPDLKDRELKKALAGKLQVPAERIVTGSGAAELIYGAAAALGTGKAMVCVPCFSEYEDALKAFRRPVVCFETEEEDGWMVTGKLAERVRKEKDLELLILCHPNNPTGRLVPADILAELARICAARHIWFLADECFLDLTEEGEKASCLALQKQCPELLVLRAFTKLYAMPGLRLGYLAAGSKETAERIRKVLPPWNISRPAQLAGLAALQEEKFAEETNNYLMKERRWLSDRLSVLGLQVWPSDTSFLLFRGPADLQERCLEEGIYIRDAASFRGISPGIWRIGVRTREENRLLLAALKKIREKKENSGWQK